MRTNVTQSLITSFVGALYVTMCLNLNAQQLTNNASSDEAKKKVAEYKTPLNINGKEVEATYIKKINGTPVALVPCGNMGVENGWDAWKASTGTNGGLPIVWTPSTLTPPRFNLTSGAGIDPCTPGTAPGAPSVPVVAGGIFGNTSIQLGQHNTSGLPPGAPATGLCGNAVSSGPGGSGGASDGCTEQLTFPLTVTAADTNFIFSYAMFIDEPDGNHPPNEQPWAGICIYDANNQPVPCGCFVYAAGSLTGFYKARCASNNGGTIWYKPWTVVGINLAAYVGQTLNVVISNVDCGKGGHMAHSYWDFACPPVSGSVTPFCAGNQTTITAPASDPNNPYTYTWYQNGNLYTGPPSSSSQIITPFPVAGDTFTVYVQQASGCNFWLPFVPQPSNPPVANFSSNIVCFNNPTVFNNASTGTPIPAWHWNFGNGNTSTAQNPSHTYSAPGSYTVTLIASYPSGCNDTIKHPVYVNPLPTANFTSTQVCLGDTTCFQNTSAISSGAITTVSWNFGDPGSGTQNISNLSSPCHIYTAVGNYNVTLTVTSDSGCQSTIVMPVVFNPPPVALFTGTAGCLNAPTTLTSNSTSGSSDPINVWSWNFGDGSANSSLVNPVHAYTTPGTYTVTLIVTTTKGCIDTVRNPVTIHTPPVANFSGPIIGCAPVCNNYSDLSTCSDGNLVAWQWTFPGGTPDLASSQHPQNICYFTPGSYGASLIITSNYGCKDTIAITPLVTVHPWPQAEFAVAPTVAPTTAPNFNFSDLWPSGVTHWVWDFGDNSPLDSTNTDPVHSYSASATANDFYAFKICLRVQNQYGCWDTTCRVVELLPEFTFYIPNTVTPNGDDANEFFFGKSRGVKEYNIWLFDRWGNLVWDCGYKGKNTDWDGPMQDGMSSFCQWDGKVEGGGLDMSGNSKELAQEDVYVWKVKLIDIFDKKHTYIGHVSVVR